MKLVLILLTLILNACSVNNNLKWQSPNKTSELRHSKAPSETSSGKSLSYYSLYDLRSGDRLATVRSIIVDGGYVGEQDIHFSDTGRTILIYENISDASPEYAHTLLYRDKDDNIYRSRYLALPTRNSNSIHDVYGEWASVVNITDESVTYRFAENEPTETKQFIELKDVGF